MKLYKYIICGGLALTLTLSSCESWLEVEPNDTRTTDYFYTTPNEMEQALIGIYNGRADCQLFQDVVGSSFGQCLGR